MEKVFSLGLYLLNPDGTQQLDSRADVSMDVPEHSPLPTYTNEDIIDLSRVWTGFDEQLPRGNLEHYWGDGGRNSVDPMRLRGEWRDAYAAWGRNPP